MPENTVYVGRPSKWGNPYKIGDEFTTIQDILGLYERWLKSKLKEDLQFLDSLKGHDLACWCPLDKPCHADVLLKLLEETPKSEVKE
jgi:hypothetical protein